MTWTDEVLTDSAQLAHLYEQTSGATATDLTGNGRTGTYADPLAAPAAYYKVADVREALLAAAGKQPTRWWPARELRDQVHGWTPAAVMIALNRLVAEGCFERDDRLRVRIAP